jgi:hypothetical protein
MEFRGIESRINLREVGEIESNEFVGWLARLSVRINTFMPNCGVYPDINSRTGV